LPAAAVQALSLRITAMTCMEQQFQAFASSSSRSRSSSAASILAQKRAAACLS
jgi:hypothetical protein